MKTIKPAAPILVMVVGCFLAATLAQMVFQNVVGELVPFMVYSIAVAFCAYRHGMLGGLPMTVLACLGAAYFFLTPTYNLDITPVKWLTCFAFLVNGTIVSLLAEIMHRGIDKAKHSKELYDDLGNAAPVMIWRADVQMRRVWFNSQWLKFRGRTVEQEMGWGWTEGIHPEDKNRMVRIYQEAFDRRESFRMAYRLLHNDGTYKWVISFGTPYYFQGEFYGYIGTCSDITEQKNMEDSLREEHRLKDEFLATLAHELRNPLAPILTGLQVLEVAKPGTDTFARAMQVMRRQVHHMTRLIDDLLDVSRITRNRIELRKERQPIRPIIEQVVETIRPVIDGNAHKFTLHLPPDPIYIDADYARIVQIISNLLNNAAKYTRPGGNICLAVYRENGDCVITVRDNGMGIPKEKIDRIFDLFVQLDRSLERASGGLGIGLTLVKKLVEMHGGSVSAKSAGIERGSEFTVRLPLSEETYKPTAPATNGSGQKVRACKILIVDDNADAAQSLGMLLNIHGHEIQVAHDGASALDKFQKFKPEIMIQDIGMPGMSGHEVARQIREIEKDSPTHVSLIALTGYGQEEDKVRSKEAGFDFHLTKPVDLADLERILYRLCGAEGSLAK